jgi:MFS family permease
MAEFGITSRAQQVLPISIFILGYVLGPLFFGPISEQYGRRTIFVSTFSLLIIFTMACALAPNWPAFLVFRVLTGIFASSPIVVTGGLNADIYNDPITRGRAMALFMTVGFDIYTVWITLKPKFQA